MLWFLFIIGGLLPIIQSDQTISHDVPVPRDMTSADFQRSITDYWTPERIANAQSKDVLAVDQASAAWILRRPPSDTRSDTFQRFVPATAPSENVTQAAASPETRSTTPRICGKVFFQVNNRDYTCSGSVVAASNRDTVITAGHCVYDYEIQMWASRFIFIPQYTNGVAPLGTWVARRITTLANWAYYRDFNSDVGVVVMHPNNQGQHVQQFTGGLGIKWNGNKQVSVHAFGYPKNIANGLTMSSCAGLATSALGITPGFNGVQLTCGMTNGASGGPWIQEYDATTMLGLQMSVNSFIITNRPGQIFGPYFSNDIYNMYKLYENQ